MHYLAFDIECARVSKTAAHILSFGYVLADEHFQILKKEDILISPGTKIRVQAKSGEGITLPYTDQMLKTKPKFYQVYEKIRALLEDPSVRVVGHAAMNDARYLNLDSKRYHLPPLAFSFWDTQVFAAERRGDFNELQGLDRLAAEFGIEFDAHCSLSDAEMTLQLLNSILRAEGKRFEEFVRESGAEPGKVAHYEAQTATTAKYREVLALRAKKKEERRLAWERRTARREKAAKAEEGEDNSSKQR